MATIILSAAGMALGGSVGGSVLGLSMAVVGRAAGATLGRTLDQRLLGQGSDPVETGRIDRFRLMGASEGSAVQQVYGRMRVAGQVIWASRFREETETSGGGKGRSRPTTVAYSYSVSLAVALCEGQISSVGRIWADGVEIAADQLSINIYQGSEDQLPDPVIEAVEGAGAAPAYRGIAYVVFEDLSLAQFGNRIPQFSFEVTRPSPAGMAPDLADLPHLLRGVALVPGTGEYSLATTQVTLDKGYGETLPINSNTPSGKADLPTSLDALQQDLPLCGSVSLVVSWFGTDLRCADCTIHPRVEANGSDPSVMPWRVSGLTRAAAGLVAQDGGVPVYGGTPADAAVIEAIAELNARGLRPVFYPFILMEQVAANGLPDPWSDAVDQPPLPWRGRITLSAAPGRPSSPDMTAGAAAQVAAFFGAAAPEHFSVVQGRVAYVGPDEWSYRRFILHYAHLCALAGGVSAFCIGSEMRSLTQIRGAVGSFPAVAQFRQLAAEVKVILGPQCQIGYAADWSEYSGYQPPGTGDKIFHLDDLWADENIGFIGIDNYMPLSDWRDGEDHLDAEWGSIYNLDYLRANVAGGEGFDWFYHSPEARAAQIRTPISDFWEEPWVWRPKDIKGWWQNPHHNRIDGTRDDAPTDWVPQSKPIWFTEFGCPAVDKGTNEPNRFVDPKSSESGLPFGSNGLRDELIQQQYLRAVQTYFADPENNPVSGDTGVRMVDVSRMHVWARDARPYPYFPANAELWADAPNYARGHWINGRMGARSLANVVAEICEQVGLLSYDVSRLHGLVRGYAVSDLESARSRIQPLMLAHGFDAAARDGTLHFVTRTGRSLQTLDAARFVAGDGDVPTLALSRAPVAETVGRVQIGFVDADGDYAVRSAEAVFADETNFTATGTDFPMVLTRAEGQRIAERWLAEARVARQSARFAVPQSAAMLGAGDVVSLELSGQVARFRIDRIEDGLARSVQAVRVEADIYRAHDTEDDPVRVATFDAPVPVAGLFLDLPMIRGDEVPHAPHFVATGQPWPGSVALFSGVADAGYTLNLVQSRRGVVGRTLSPLYRAPSGLWDNGGPVRVAFTAENVSAAAEDAVLAGANIIAIGDGSDANWEVFQFADAELVGPNTYDLARRLRGQAGTDGTMPEDWPVGSYVVLLNGTPKQIDLPLSARGTLRDYRYGPAQRPLDDPSYRLESEAFSGIGLRPYSVCHVRAITTDANDTTVTWIRRTRLDGDNWSGLDVPLSEESERYLVRVIANGAVVRDTVVSAPQFEYLAWQKAVDAVVVPYRIDVAQISTSFGTGPARGIVVGG